MALYRNYSRGRECDGGEMNISDKILDKMKSEKPLYGQPCNNCGLCCASTPCALAMSVFNIQQWSGPCPALEVTIGEKINSGCGLVNNPLKFAPIIVNKIGIDRAKKGAALLVGAGIGCDGQLVGEPSDDEFRDSLKLKFKTDDFFTAIKDWELLNDNANKNNR